MGADVTRGESDNPTKKIDVRFAEYVKKHEMEMSQHMISGVPDYAFALDNELRSQLRQIPHFESICRTVMGTVATRAMQIANQDDLLVGPTQFSEIYAMGLECAQRLGIGVPNIYIENQPVMNAYTVATDDISPLIVLYSGIVERMSPQELKAVIAHECGHIHNQHAVLKNVVDYLLNLTSGAGLPGFILSSANIALMQFWTRASEVTADRAALICADSVEDVLKVNYKLMQGGVLGDAYDDGFDLEALRGQLNYTLDSSARVLEVLSDHPASIRRIFAAKEFSECETYLSWRPEMRHVDSVARSKEECDARCRKLVAILKNK